MADLVSPLLQWLNAHPQLAGLFTFIISAAESVAIIGTIVPGSIMMTAIGTLAGAGVIPLWPTIFWAILGAIVGDGISYWIGYYFKGSLHRVWPFRKYPALLKTGELFFHKYGYMSVFIGRFVGPVRALVPLVAGMLGMRPLIFTIANVTSAIGWAPAYMLPGILLGAASLELPPDIAVHVILAVLFMAMFVMLCLWFLYKIFQLIQNQLNLLQSKIWKSLEKSRHFSSVTTILKHHDTKKTYGQFGLALLFILTSFLFLCLALYVKWNGPQNIMINEMMFHLFRGLSIRSYTLDNIMINITLLGQKQVIFPVVIALFFWLIAKKQRRSALHALLLGVATGGSVFVLKHLFKIQRPWGIFHSPLTYSMPSGHAALSATLYIGFAFLLATTFSSKLRKLTYAIAILIALLISISRLYLGAHWFTDIISSWLLSAALLSLIVISYQRHPSKPVKPLSTFLACFLTLCLTFTFYHHYRFTQLQVDYAQINWPVVNIDMNEWWQKNELLPTYRTSLFGFPSQAINIEWVGNLEEIRQSLLKEGWGKPPARDIVSTLHRIADIGSGAYLPLVSPQFLDKRPALTLTRQTPDGRHLVIRLWDANRTVTQSKEALWVGFVGTIPRSYSWIFRNNPSELTINPSQVFPMKTGIGDWQWKLMTTTRASNGSSQKQQNILLLRRNKTIHKKK